MNNYCTNCGTRLGSKDFACNNCGIPIVDIPIGYKFKSNQQKKKQKKILTVIAAIMLLCVSLVVGKIVFTEIKIKKLEKDYVLPFIKENYPINSATVKFSDAGKCVISGDCYTNFGSGCDGSSCEPYKYMDRFKCKSYYYDANINGKNFTITVFKKDGKYGVVEGKNIYGKDKEKNEEADIDRLEEDYVLPYIKEKYYIDDPVINYLESGKCIISGSCLHDRGGWDSPCEEYKYLNEDECKSYYFESKINGETHTFTVFNRDGVYNVVEGKNIYGTDKSN